MVQLVASEGTVCRDAVVSFTCSANGIPSVFTYQLYVNGVMVVNGSRSGIWNRVMSIGGVFNYICAASNIIGTANSASVSVTVTGIKDNFSRKKKKKQYSTVKPRGVG